MGREQTEAAIDIEELARLERVARLLDARFRIPGTGFYFGVDSLLGLLPIVGDGLGVLPAVYIMHRAHRMGASSHVLARMALNVAIDVAVGSIPIAGDIFDAAFKANRRNVDLLRRSLSANAKPVSVGGSEQAVLKWR